jgi:serine/threonine-protein kinase HipA
MEDFCVLLGLRPSAKYETTWERIGKAVRTHIPPERRYETFRQLTAILLLTYALRNADCHAKNLALLYTSRDDVHLSPAYDFVTTCIYPGYQNNPPGIGFMGKKTWLPGKNLINFISSTFGIPARDQTALVEQISDAIADTAPKVKQSIKEVPGFRDTGKYMLRAWNEGVSCLRDRRIYAIGKWKGADSFEGISDPPKLQNKREIIGRSPLLGRHSKPRK